jgi:FkbM family methyltransferase
VKLPVGERLLLKLDRNEYFEWMLVWNYYAPQLRAILSRALRPGDRFVDIGANMGYFATYAARLVGPAGRVIAVEPDPRAATLLAENVALNELGNVEIVAAAVGDVDGTLQFNLAEQLGWSSAVEHAGMSTARQISVPVTTVDLLVAERLAEAAPRLIKVDVEGLEFLVLKGATETLRLARPAFLLEVNHLGLRASGQTLSDIARKLEEAEYSLHWVSGNRGLVRLTRRIQLQKVHDVAEYASLDGDLLALPPDWQWE